jgi:MgtE intracellular N domain
MTTPSQIIEAMATMTTARASAVLAAMPFDNARAVAAAMPTERALALTGAMQPDQAIAVMTAMTPDKVRAVEATMTPDEALAVVAAMPSTPEVAAGRMRLRIDAIRSLATPLSVKRSVAELAAGSCASGPKYWSREQDRQLREHYSYAQVRDGISKVLTEVDAADCDPAITETINASHEACTADGRLRIFDRDHDIEDFARHVVQSAYLLGTARVEWQRMTEPSWRARRSVRKAAPSKLLGSQFNPKAMIRGLARDAIARCLPAIQNIITHLPESDRQAAADDAERVLRNYVRSLGKLRTLVRNLADEYRRWECGFGAVDLAIIEAASMLGYIRELAARMEPSDGATRLRKRVDEAWNTAVAAMAQLATTRLHVMSLDAWQYHKADMVAFAQADGGIGPDLEVLYHVPGSKFMGY